MKSNEFNRTKEGENQCSSLSSTAARFGDTIKSSSLMENEIKTVMNLSCEDNEVDLDVTTNGCMFDDQACGLSPSKSKDLNEESIINTLRNTSEDGDDDDVMEIALSDYTHDQVSGLQSSQSESLEQINSKTSTERLLQLQTETFDEKTNKEIHGLEKESSIKDTNVWHGQLMDDDEEDDHYNPFYFESDHLALKDNKQ